MKSFKKIAVILGAGPAGLACAYELIKKNTDIKPVIIEKLDCVGGLSRTIYFDNLGVDIGGHRLYTTNPYIKSIWEEFLPHQSFPSIDDLYTNRITDYPDGGKDPEQEDDVMLIRNRFSSIIYNNTFFDYPIKFNIETIKKLGFLNSLSAGFSYIRSIFFKREVKNLEDFMINRFGQKLYNIFFKEYTKKVWGKDASEISSEWGEERIRKLSLAKTILNSVLSKFSFLKFQKETSLIDKFYYPKFGCSQLWNKIAKYITDNGGKIIYNSEFEGFETNDDKIISINYKKDNETNKITANYFISSIPISELIKGIDAPFDIKQNAINLPYRDYILVSFLLDHFNLKNKTEYKTINDITPECWIYLQEPDAIASRIQIMNNWSPYLVGDINKNYLVSLEYYANEDDEFWAKTDDEIINLAIEEAEEYNLFDMKSILKTKIIREKRAYPSYFGTYKNIDKVKKFLSLYNNLYLIGRNGMHKYNNMDEAMLTGIQAANSIIDKV